MENAQHMILLGRENSLAMVPLDHDDHEKSINDIMNRRLKNRERQRRYRARKRLEADRKKLCSINNSDPLQIEMQIDGIPDKCVTRVHCRRNWKKDARKAHSLKEQEVILNGPLVSGLTSASENQATLLLWS
ncbi:Formimidoylglutamase [Actinidia chinensis var. chinensis]|uniref:Formimidoylglutamase n=1 Tax=Actinidia chinensis var. chinensis TaxID=1590841 RepID=A0A2R6PCX1_ACTCC|nr:Formimidoylglutamase [Actinidia chinensis var. chinensis]